MNMYLFKMSIINCKSCSDQFDLDIEQEKVKEINKEFYCLECYDEINAELNKAKKLELINEYEDFE